MCHEKLGNSKQEEEDYRRVLEISPDNVNALYHLGLFYERQDKLQEALAYFDELVQLNPNFSPVYNAKGMVYDKLEDYAASYR